MSHLKNFYRPCTQWLSLLAVLVLLGLGGCKSNGTDPGSVKTDSAKAEAPAPNEEGDKAAADAPAADIYPGMNLGVLSPKQRSKFVDIAKAEVCPCPDAAESLHECLQAPEKLCPLAMQVASQIGGGVQRGASETDILDGIAQFVENSRKSHQFDLQGVPRKGPESAPVKIVEFADFECPHCKVASAMLGDISERYGDKIAVYFKQFPLGGHQHSMGAAIAALAAHNQGKFWQMHDLIFENQRTLSPDAFRKFAGRLGLNMSKFETDQKSPMIAAVIERDRNEGDKAGITGTPTLYINGRKYMGPIDEKAISQAIDAALAESAAKGADEGAEKEAEKPVEK